ncbi:MAG: VanZ family protein [candidate division KSB1 bacterium]
MTLGPYQKLSRTLLVIMILGLIYVTAVPFGLIVPKRYHAKWERTELVPFYPNPGARLTGFDTVANILLFLPLGFFLHGWRKLRRSPEPVGLSQTLLLAAALSTSIEVVQFFLKDRFSSINDVMFNVVGAALGALAAHYLYEKALARAFRFWQLLTARPGLLLLAALSLCYLFWMLLPLNFTLAPHNILRKWVQWQYSLEYLRSLFDKPYTLDLREYWLLVAVEHLLYGLVIGQVYALCARWYFPPARRDYWLGVGMLFFGLALLTLLQFCVIGGNPDVLTLLSVSGGLAGGLLLMETLTRHHAPHLPLGFNYYTEAALVIPYFLFFLLLVLRPDLPDFRVEIPALATNGAQSSMVADFAQRLLLSVQPEILRQGGSAYLRLFVKLLAASIFLVFVLLYLFPQHVRHTQLRERLYFIGGSVLFGLAAQALRFWLWRANVSLIAVAAITSGVLLAASLANWWRNENILGIKSSEHSRIA